MKLLKLIFPGFLLCTNVMGQISFHEDFENPDSVISSGTVNWALSNVAQTSGLFCDSIAAYNGTSYLTTIPFSTLGQYYVTLEFNHVATNEILDTNTIEISTNGGATYTQIGGNEYRGQSVVLASNGNISQYDYQEWGQSIPWYLYYYSNWVPDINVFWRHEKYDISALAANQSNVLVRFVSLNSFSYPAGAWYLDDLEINGQPYSFTSTPECNGNGTATVAPYFGTAPYTYSWNTAPVQTNATATGLTGGSYTCIITDNTGASLTVTDTVRSSFGLQVQSKNPSCTFTDGYVYTTVFNVLNPPISYSWSNGATVAYVQNLAAGNYTLTVTDSLGCSIQRNFNLSCVFTYTNIQIASVDADCNQNNGSASVTNVIGGTPPFTYSWNTTPVQTTQTITGLPKNTWYNVTVTDGAGLSGTTYALINENNTLTVSATEQPSACASATGILTAQVTGGTTPYIYYWNSLPVQTTQACTGLAAGVYQLTVTDANTCTKGIQKTLHESTGINANISVTPTVCMGNTGTANLSFSGGVAPFTYSWSTVPVQTTPTATGLGYGNYSVLLTDAAGCSLTKTAYVYNTNPFTVSFTQAFNSCNCTDLTIGVTGGTPPYTYLWDDGSTNQTDSCKTTGWYLLSVTDAAGCSYIFNHYLNIPSNCYIQVQGYIFNDQNKNCIKDGGEFGLANVQVRLNGALYGASTNTDNNSTGHYSFTVPNDVYDLSYSLLPNFGNLCPAGGTVNINVIAGTVVNQDFADTATIVIDDMEIYSHSSWPNMPGANTYSNISIRNKGTTQVTGNLKTTHDAILNYISSSPAGIYNLSAKTIDWNYAGMVPGEYKTSGYTSNIPAGTLLGTMLTETDTVFPIATDVTPGDNYSTYTTPVVGSYDPNNKTNNPEGVMDPSDSVHQYRINFQNTGTAYALKVVVIDTLDAYLDINTLHDVNASHPFVTDTTNGVLHFIFNNIWLPDSTANEALSHGYVEFRINHTSNIPNNTYIRNKAEIYFDFNAPIVTNTAENIISIMAIDEKGKTYRINLYPNPAGDMLNLFSGEMPRGTYSISVIDAQGRCVMNESAANEGNRFSKIISTQKLTQGIYLIHISGMGINVTARFEKM